MSSKKGKLVVISAPSGTGKSTVINRLLELHSELVFSVSATTRAPRDGEEEGVAYYFVTREKFRAMIEQDDFLEYAEYIGEFYGTPRRPIYDCIAEGKDVLLDIDVQGARQVMALEEDAITIFIIPPDLEELERRLRGRRTDSEDKMAARLERARMELNDRVYYKHIVVNDDVDHAVAEIIAIITSKG